MVPDTDDQQDDSGNNGTVDIDETALIKVLRSLSKTPRFNVNGLINGRTLLHNACAKGLLRSVRFLVEVLDADLEIMSTVGWRASHYAAAGGTVATILYLLECGADMNARTGDTPTEASLDVSKKIQKNVAGPTRTLRRSARCKHKNARGY